MDRCIYTDQIPISHRGLFTLHYLCGAMGPAVFPRSMGFLLFLSGSLGFAGFAGFFLDFFLIFRGYLDKLIVGSYVTILVLDISVCALHMLGCNSVHSTPYTMK